MKIYIINLKRCEDRRMAMQLEVQKLSANFKFHIFDAIDSRADEHIFFMKKHFSKITRYLLGRDLTGGEFACFASHYSMWNECIKQNEPIIILEDDITIQPHFEEGIKSITENKYEFVKLTSTNIDSANKQKTNHLIDKHFILSFNGLDGTQGYYITPNSAKKFIKHSNKWYKPVDNYMESFWIHNIPTITYTPKLITDNLNCNDTTIENRKTKISFGYKLTREISKAFSDIRKFFYIKFYPRCSFCKKINSKEILVR